MEFILRVEDRDRQAPYDLVEMSRIVFASRLDRAQASGHRGGVQDTREVESFIGAMPELLDSSDPKIERFPGLAEWWTGW